MPLDAAGGWLGLARAPQGRTLCQGTGAFYDREITRRRLHCGGCTASDAGRAATARRDPRGCGMRRTHRCLWVEARSASQRAGSLPASSSGTPASAVRPDALEPPEPPAAKLSEPAAPAASFGASACGTPFPVAPNPGGSRSGPVHPALGRTLSVATLSKHSSQRCQFLRALSWILTRASRVIARCSRPLRRSSASVRRHRSADATS